MIIKGRSRNTAKSIWFLLLLIPLLGLLWLRFSPSETEDGVIYTGEKIFCDAENTDGEYFINGDYRFESAASQSDYKKFDGKYSSRIKKEDTYGLTYIMNNPVPGKTFKVSIWSYNQHPVRAFLVVSSPDGEAFYKATDKTVERNGEYWDRRELSFVVPKVNTPKLLKIYVYKEGQNDIYFDNLLIEEQEPINIPNSEIFQPKTFKIQLNSDAEEYITSTKKKSISLGTIYHDGQKIKSRITVDGKEKGIKFRIKGDWLDHLGKYPSLRIDMDSEESWQGMQSFSVQEPYTRGFLRQWVFFKFLDYVDVLHPRYDFFNYQINSEEPIVFSFEEHFTKNLVENRSRREGPIVKLTEDRIWDVTRRTIKTFNRSLPTIDEKNKAFWTSEIRSFKEGKLKANPTLKNNFEIAQNLMLQFKFGLKPSDEIFDIKRLTQYMALVDICMAKHAITWHNQRFYYNPVTALLEPIGFDAYTSEHPRAYAKKIHADEVYHAPGDLNEPLDELFYDDRFAENYFKYLYELSDPDFIVQLIGNIEEEIQQREQFINTKFKEYAYDRNEILEKAKRIRILFEPYANSLLVFRDKIEGSKQYLKLINNHNFPIRVWDGSDKSKSKIIYPQSRLKAPQYFDWITAKELTTIKYEVIGFQKEYRKEILDWTTPQSYSPRQDLNYVNPTEYEGHLSYDGYNYIFKSGKLKINKPLIIPAESKVVLEPGFHLEMKEDAFFLSFSSVDARGDEEERITIESTDGKAGSFSVLQAENKSRLRYVKFKNQNTLIKDKWNLTGAVNFYESDVDITHCQFYENNCEDALNIVRSDFNLAHSHFNDTYGDAFDADFCKGLINKCLFTESGNDAIDVSGSFIDVDDTIISIVGDKGVSGGENSKVFADNLQIDNAIIGVASKDLSVVTLRDLELKNCITGLAAFQKKPEFGPATIKLYKYNFDNIKTKWRIENNSSLLDLNNE